MGDTGPGGGIVFYVAGADFTSTGSDCGTACRYLEAAPSDLSVGIIWATGATACYDSGSSTSNNDCSTNTVHSGSADEQRAARDASVLIGKGMENTNRIHDRLTTVGGAAASAYAAGIALEYTNGGKSDWHLASENEMFELCKYALSGTCGVTGSRREGFSSGTYWTSTEVSWNGTRTQSFNQGAKGTFAKSNSLRVRPVRAF